MLPLPERPRLKPHVAVVPFSRDVVLLKGPGVFARLSGEGVGDLIDLLPLLDGAGTIPEIARRAGRREEDVRDVVEALHADRMLDDAALDEAWRVPAEDRARLQPQLNLLSQLTRNVPAAQNRLLDARVLVAGGGALAQATRGLLLESGVGAVEEARPSAPDLRRVTADEWARLIRGFDHVVLAVDEPASTAFLAMNDAALAEGATWTAAFLDQHEAIVGPTIVPRESACWRCYDLRVLGAHPNVDRLMAYEAAREEGRARLGPSRLPGFAPIAGAFLAQALVQTLARVTVPPLAGRVARVEFLEYRVERHRVLRIPRCPACGREGVPDVDRYGLEPVSLG